MSDGIGGTDGTRPMGANGGRFAAVFPGVARSSQPLQTLSFIEDHEQIQAQSVIDEQFRQLTKSDQVPAGITFREHNHLTRYFCIVKIYVRPEELKEVTDVNGNKQKIYLPDTVRAEDRYQSCTGLVVAVGPDAFKDKEGKPKRELFRVGDWVVFPRADIIRVDFCGIPLGIMTDERAVIVTDDPTYWAQGSVTFKA